MSQRISVTVDDETVRRLKAIVRVKTSAGFQSSLSFEAARAIRNQLRDENAGVDVDTQILRKSDDITN